MAVRRPLVNVAGDLQELPVGDTVAGASGGASATIEQFNLMDSFPWMIGATATTAVRTQTSTLHTATAARFSPFFLPGQLTLAEVAIQTVAAGTNNLQLGIFDALGVRVWTSGDRSTVAGVLEIPVSPAVVLPSGQYYWVSTVGSALVSATAVYQTTPPFTSATAQSRWGTVATVGGAMPAALTPTLINESVGGFMLYALLSAWST